MPYCTLQDLIERYGESELVELTDEHDIGAIDETRIARAIADVDGLIDGYLGERYDLPLAVVPQVLTRNACDLVRYDLYDHPPESIKDRQKEAMQFLRDAAAGKVTLGVETPDEAAVEAVSVTSQPRRFGRNGLL